ncbi:Single-stranded-DNA-specific exonuclease RecJ [Oligella urethralis]|uniref:single-stranded-DNA-specific exonuclease RecJ n=1 Tax=Oligella TaxID=90243 RepID=UPI0008A4427E|nr:MULTISPECIES: single-stranded-DNA-specific exonuclease RecJ [Oligella]OFS83010.1 single-stranded-DNA-specific exonuclease RecJ [Oligella sp. HMSC05A10]WOS37403.1 Single-stranded-DNA-specific exonuclease RecJ [Oligella urethralis]
MVASVIIKERQGSTAHSQALEASGLHPLLARLYAARGVQSASQTDYRWNQLIHPQQLSQNQKAAQLIADAIEQNKRLLIVADYDCDGATACAVAICGLKAMGATVDFMVPNRFETGYGLSREVIDLILARYDELPDMIITVDNGIASVDGVNYAQAQGIDVIVTDHHLPGDELPAALAIVNPNQADCHFPSKNLAGVGVMYYLLMALRAELKQRGHFDATNQPRLDSLADLVALGTVADVVKLDANNRILVSQGLERMRRGLMRPGIRALFEVSGTSYHQASASDLGFRIGPRINAAGRLADMSIGIRCLITEDEAEAMQLAQALDKINQERRHIEQEMNEQALESLAQEEEQNATPLASIAVYKEDWHQGVVGIVASRLKEKFWRPVIAFAPADNGELRGSGRSIPEIHLRDVLDLVSKRHPEMILKFGGHAMAAGLSIRQEDFEAFKLALHEAIITMSGKSSFASVIETDGPLATEHASSRVATLLDQQVWGAGFPPPCFNDVFIVRSQRILKDKHLKLRLEKDQVLYDAIWFNHTELLPEMARVVYELKANEWNGQVNVQLLIQHAEAYTAVQ